MLNPGKDKLNILRNMKKICRKKKREVTENANAAHPTFSILLKKTQPEVKKKTRTV